MKIIITNNKKPIDQEIKKVKNRKVFFVVIMIMINKKIKDKLKFKIWKNKSKSQLKMQMQIIKLKKINKTIKIWIVWKI